MTMSPAPDRGQWRCERLSRRSAFAHIALTSEKAGSTMASARNLREQRFSAIASAGAVVVKSWGGNLSKEIFDDRSAAISRSARTTWLYVSNVAATDPAMGYSSGSSTTSTIGRSRLDRIARTQEFHRRVASSSPSGRKACAFSYQSMASRNPS